MIKISQFWQGVTAQYILYSVEWFYSFFPELHNWYAINVMLNPFFDKVSH